MQPANTSCRANLCQSPSDRSVWAQRGGTDLQLAVEDDVLEEAWRLMLGREGGGKVASHWRRLCHCLVVGSRCDETAGRFPDLHLLLPVHASGSAAPLLLLAFLVTPLVALAHRRVEAPCPRVSLRGDESQP